MFGDDTTSMDRLALEADLGRTHALLEQGVTPFFEWLEFMRDQEPETRVLGPKHPLSNLVALYLGVMLKQEMMVIPGEYKEKGAPRYVIEYFHDTSRQMVPLPRPFEIILDRLDLFLTHFSPQSGGPATGCWIHEVASWMLARQDMQDLRLFSNEGHYGVRVRQRPGLVRNMWFVEYADLEGEWRLYSKRRRHRLEVAHYYKRAIWALKFARAEVEKRRPREEETRT
jgi:hypothetical protein